MRIILGQSEDFKGAPSWATHVFKNQHGLTGFTDDEFSQILIKELKVNTTFVRHLWPELVAKRKNEDNEEINVIASVVMSRVTEEKIK